MEKRLNKVSVFMTDEELARVSAHAVLRKRRAASYLRDAGLNCIPPTIPALNRDAWVELSRAAGNLATVATAMRGGDFIELSEIKQKLADFRLKLIGADLKTDSELAIVSNNMTGDLS